MRISFLIINYVIAASLYAQQLPDGALQPVRVRSVDIVHCKAELEFEFWNGKVSGVATLTFTPLKPLDSLSLDAIALTVRNVRDANRNTQLTVRTVPKHLVIRLPRTLAIGETMSVAIAYDAVPRAGMYFRRDPATQKYFVHTYGEGGLHANWLPIYNDVNDKFSTEMLVTVPPPYTVISNGTLVQTIMKGEGFTTYHYRQELPHSSYLISLYVGDFERGSLAPPFGKIPAGYWVPQGRLKEGAFAFRNTTRMVEFFSNKFSYRYPWVKYDQVAVPDYSIGAMEHTGVTGLRDCILRDSTAPDEAGPPTFDEYYSDWSAEALIAHELAHHWFGNNVTCRSLGNIWLNESFGSYLMMLWDEESLGRDQLLFALHLARQHYFNYVKKEHIIRPLEYHRYDDADAIFNEEHTYLKGAAVLHMMRSVLGDEAFFRSLSHYLKKHEFGNVISNDLLIAIQEVTGENIEWFFDDWINGAGHPILDVSYSYIPSLNIIDLHFKQVQPVVEGRGLFTLPVKVTIATRTKRWDESVTIRNAEECFVLRCAEKPLIVSVDGEGSLVAEINFPKDAEQLAYQATHDALPGRLRAMRELAVQYPTDEITLATLASIIGSPRHWSDAAEAAVLLGEVRSAEAMKISKQALASADYRIRKAGVIGLKLFGPSASDVLKEVITNDRHTDVVGTAIVALANVDKRLGPEFIKQQLKRSSWYNEITIACLKACGELENTALLPLIKQYTQPVYNQYVRDAAIEAWKSCAPQDKELHTLLGELARGATLRLQQKAIEMLGDLYVREAVPLLEEIVRLDFDRNLTNGAQRALDKIIRVHGQK